MRLGVAQWPIGRAAGHDAWVARLEREVAAAAGSGAELLVLPEYAALEAATGVSPDLDGELQRAVALAPGLVEAAQGIAVAHRVWLLPGSLPFRRGAQLVNRAPLISPDGRVRFQDKHMMTRFEDETWGVSAGAAPRVFDTPWGRIGIAICFDLEFPALVRAQVEAGAWLILAPSCTDTRHGASRIRIAAAARAMENQCFVAVSPTIGAAPWSAALDANCGVAAVLGPVDRGFPADGVIAAGAPDQAAWVFATLDEGSLLTVRREGAVRNHAWPPPPPPCDIVPC